MPVPTRHQQDHVSFLVITTKNASRARGECARPWVLFHKITIYTYKAFLSRKTGKMKKAQELLGND